MSEAFISYSRADSAFADKLGEDLEKRGIGVWIDRESIEGGAAWRASISKAIRSCCAFILILSPRSTQSGQVSKELSVAETHNRLIIPVVLETCDIPPGMELQLAELQWISFAEHPYDAALERLTRVITEARSRAVAPAPQGQVAPEHPSPVTARAATPQRTDSRASASAASTGSSRKWLLAGAAAVALAGASFGAFRFIQEPGSTPAIENTARTDSKPAPAEASAVVSAAIPTVATAMGAKDSVVPTVAQASPDAARAEGRTQSSAAPAGPGSKGATPASPPSGSERGATRSEVQQRTAPAAEKPAVVARADPAPTKPANVPRADAAPASGSRPIVGNSRTLVYHYPGCPNYYTIAPQARIEFASAREAEGAGYKLSVNCDDPSGARAAATVLANSNTKEYFLSHCRGYAATKPQYRVPFSSTAEAEQAGYKRSEKCP